MPSPEPFEPTRIFRPAENLVARQVGSDSVLVPIRQNVANLDFVYTLSPVAARVWSLLDGQRDAGQILSTILEEYDVTREVAEADVQELLTDLAGAGLILAVG